MYPNFQSEPGSCCLVKEAQPVNYAHFFLLVKDTLLLPGGNGIVSSKRIAQSLQSINKLMYRRQTMKMIKTLIKTELNKLFAVKTQIKKDCVM